MGFDFDKDVPADHVGTIVRPKIDAAIGQGERNFPLHIETTKLEFDFQ